MDQQSNCLRIDFGISLEFQEQLLDRRHQNEITYSLSGSEKAAALAKMAFLTLSQPEYPFHLSTLNASREIRRLHRLPGIWHSHVPLHKGYPQYRNKSWLFFFSLQWMFVTVFFFNPNDILLLLSHSTKQHEILPLSKIL